jgi:1-deoxy-D-xylulose-5-phosphate reductoisomerase
VEFVDGSVVCQMSPNDMRFPILYALSYPERIPTPLARLDLAALGKLELFALDKTRYPAVPLAYAALRAGGSAPAVLNAANEIAVEAFLDGLIPYAAIVELVARVLTKHEVAAVESVAAALEHDAWGRREAKALLPSLERKPAPLRSAAAPSMPA